MATKKGAPKKAAKAAKPEKKAPATKQAAAQKEDKADKKASSTKAVVAAKAPAKKAAAPAKETVKAASKKATVASTDDKGKTKAPAKEVPAKEVAPTKKTEVAADTEQAVKPEIKPLETKEPAKSVAKPENVVIPQTSTSKSVKYDPEFSKSVLDTNFNQAQNNGPTMRYSDAELSEFRDLINKKLETAKKELSYLQGLITRKDESGDLDEGRYMTMEDGSMSMEREQLSQMASRQIQFIDHLEKAIMRIENKTYGVCRVTGKLIEKARLRAVPHATLSMEAKQMRK